MERRRGILVVFLEKGVFRHNHYWFLLCCFENILGNIFVVDNQAESEVIEPAVGHNQASAGTVGGSPAVFDFPFCGLTVFVEVYGGEGHGVGRAAVEGCDSVGLVHREVR